MLALARRDTWRLAFVVLLVLVGGCSQGSREEQDREIIEVVSNLDVVKAMHSSASREKLGITVSVGRPPSDQVEVGTKIDTYLKVSASDGYMVKDFPVTAWVEKSGFATGAVAFGARHPLPGNGEMLFPGSSGTLGWDVVCQRAGLGIYGGKVVAGWRELIPIVQGNSTTYKTGEEWLEGPTVIEVKVAVECVAKDATPVVTPTPVILEPTLAAYATPVPSFDQAIDVVFIGNGRYPMIQFDLQLDAAGCDAPAWVSIGDASIFALDLPSQAVSATGDECGFGTVDDLDTGEVFVSTSQWASYCSLNKSTIPAVLDACESSNAVTTPVPTSTRSPKVEAVLVNPCDAVDLSCATSVLGSPVEQSQQHEGGSGWLCSYDVEEQPFESFFTAWLQVYTGKLDMDRMTRTFFNSRGYGESQSDFVVLNDENGVVADLLKAGVVHTDQHVFPFYMGERRSDLGPLVIMHRMGTGERGAQLELVAQVPGYDLFIELTIYRSESWDASSLPQDQLEAWIKAQPAIGEFESRAIALAKQLIAGEIAGQSQ